MQNLTLTNEEELILTKQPKFNLNFTLQEDQKLEDGKHRQEIGRDTPGGCTPAMGEYQTMPEVPSKIEGGGVELHTREG